MQLSEIVKLFSKRKPVLEIWVLVFNVVARGHRPPSLLEDLENGSRPVRANRFSCFFFSRVIGNCMKPPLNEPTILPLLLFLLRLLEFFLFFVFFSFCFEISQYYEMYRSYVSAIENFQFLNYCCWNFSLMECKCKRIFKLTFQREILLPIQNI